MRYEVLTRDGVRIVASSPADAVALAKAVAEDEAASQKKARRAVSGSANGHAPTAPPANLFENEDTEELNSLGASSEVKQYWTKLNLAQRMALRSIIRSPNGVALEEIRSAADLASTRETSVLLSQCARVAGKCGIKRSDLATFEIRGAREQRTSVYFPGPLLRRPEEAPT